MFQRHVSWVELIVGRTTVLFEASILFIGSEHGLEHSSEVGPREDTIVRHDVVLPVGLKIVKMAEAAGIIVAQIERHKGVPIIDTVQFLPLHKVLQVVLENGALGNGC